MARTDWVGLRVARLRDMAGMTQGELADAVGVSQAYISMIENGRRPVDKRTLLISLATTLGVSVPELLGQPWQPRTADDLVIARASAAIRLALDGSGGAPAQPGSLAAKADAVIGARVVCDYPALAELLPSLIAEARTVANETTSPHVRDAALDALVKACVFGALAMKTTGYVDLAMRLAERAQLAASKLGTPVHVAAAQFAVCQVLMAEGVRERALAISAYGADAIQPLVGTVAPAAGWYSHLHMQAALCAATLGDAAAATAHLDEAAEVAKIAGLDVWHRDDMSTNVAIWRVTAALENGGDPAAAPDLARKVDKSKVRTPQRLARLFMDTGRGHWAREDVPAATTAFSAAMEVAPAEVRNRGSVREIVGQIVRDAGRRAGGNGQLRDLAVRMGIDPTEPLAEV